MWAKTLIISKSILRFLSFLKNGYKTYVELDFLIFENCEGYMIIFLTISQLNYFLFALFMCKRILSQKFHKKWGINMQTSVA